MNSLAITKPGGLSYTQDDINWALQGLNEALANFLNQNGYNSYVVSGCTLTTISTNVVGHTAGVIVLNGEICVIDADTVGINIITYPQNDWYFEKVTTYDPTGLKNFFSGGPKNMYQINKVVLKYDLTPPVGSVGIASMVTYAELLSSILATQGVQFENTIGLAIGTGALSGTQANLNQNGNIFPLSFTTGATITNIVGPVQDDEIGTPIWIQFLGGSPSDSITIVSGPTMSTPNNRNYIYRSGDWAMFIWQGTGVWALIEKDTRGPWQSPTTFGASWTNWSYEPFQYRINSDGMVTLEGALNKAAYTTFADNVFTFPPAFRPAQLKNFCINTAAGQPVNISIDPSTGFMSILINGISSPTAVSVCFDGLSFYTD